MITAEPLRFSVAVTFAIAVTFSFYIQAKLFQETNSIARTNKLRLPVPLTNTKPCAYKHFNKFTLTNLTICLMKNNKFN